MPIASPLQQSCHTPCTDLLIPPTGTLFVSSSISSKSSDSSIHAGQQLSRSTQQQLLGSTHSAGSRRLQQAGVYQCPVGCLDGWCAEDAARGGLRCLKCVDTLIVDRATGLCGESACSTAFRTPLT
jgi:hypothetical protein